MRKEDVVEALKVLAVLAAAAGVLWLNIWSAQQPQPAPPSHIPPGYRTHP